jgi:PEGA domain-containing protein
MSRVRLIAAVSALSAMVFALAGCSSSSAPDWLKPTPQAPRALQFESVPPGANVQTAQGQTCWTPCALSVPAISQSVTFSKEGYLAQTVQVGVREGEHSFFSSKPPELVPNPLQVTLAALPPPPPKGKLRPGKIAAAPRVPPPPVAPQLRPAPQPEPPDQSYNSPPTPWRTNPGSSSPFPR